MDQTQEQIAAAMVGLCQVRCALEAVAKGRAVMVGSDGLLDAQTAGSLLGPIDESLVTLDRLTHGRLWQVVDGPSGHRFRA